MITPYFCIMKIHPSSSPSPQMTRKKKMSLPASARLNPSALNVTAADELLSGQDEDDLRDVDAVFESLLNNTFDEEEEDAVSKRAPNSKQLQLQQQQQRQEQSGTPSPSPSEYDTACDPWDDY